MLQKKDLVGLIDVTKAELTELLDVAAEMKAHLKAGEKNLSYLKGKTATILFYENSTRTRTSFELAAKYLGATVINIAAGSSSVAKGETTKLTVPQSGTWKWSSDKTSVAKVNATTGVVTSLPKRSIR